MTHRDLHIATERDVVRQVLHEGARSFGLGPYVEPDEPEFADGRGPRLPGHVDLTPRQRRIRNAAETRRHRKRKRNSRRHDG